MKHLFSPSGLALILSLALVLWLASGPVQRRLQAAGEPPAQASAGAPLPQASTPLVSVRVIESTAAPVQPELIINGQTAPSRSVRLRAETSGRVVATPVGKGGVVEADTVLVELDERDRPYRAREAEARLAQRELEYEAARRLGEKGFRAQTKVAEARAELEATRAEVESARLDLRRIAVRAPFKAVLESRAIEVGDYVTVGDEVALLIEQDPYLVAGDAPEALAGQFALGQEGAAQLADDSTVMGRVRYIASEADPGTRTFRVEIEVPNPQGRFQAGMSARILVREPPQAAHRVSAAALVLDDRGAVGIKSVDDDGVVRFNPARIVKAEAEALWLGGLPDHVRIITTGQGYVAAGQKVTAQVEAPTEPGS